MKIVVLTTVHRKGDNRIFFKEIASLKKKYEDVYFVVSSEEKAPFELEGIKIHPLPVPNSFFSRLIKNQIVAFRKIRKLKPDVIHFHDPELILFAWIFKKFLRTKIIFDIHENVSESLLTRNYIPAIFRKFVSKTYSLIEKMLIKDFDALIIAETSYRKIYGETPVEILNYPILHSSSFEKNFDDVINFAYVGGITEARCIFQIIEIFARVKKFSPESKLFLIGPFASKELENRVKTRIEKLNIKNNVSVYGFLEITEVYNILKKAHIGFSLMKPLENYKESLSTKIFDYMANKMTYFVSDFPIYKKYARQDETGFMVDCETIEFVVDKIKMLLENRKLLKEYAERGFLKVSTEWNWQTQEEKLLKLYEEKIFSF